MAKVNDNVNHPSHYEGSHKETWQMMVDIWGDEAFISYCEINAFKYRMRAGKKEGSPTEEDIKKALWYENKAKELSNGI